MSALDKVAAIHPLAALEAAWIAFLLDLPMSWLRA